MKLVYTDRIVNRLTQLVTEIQAACHSGWDYYDRLRELKHYCDATPALARCLADLPKVPYDFTMDWRNVPDPWPGGKASYGMRWSAVEQMIVGGPRQVDQAWTQIGGDWSGGLARVTDRFVVPIYNYLVDQMESCSTMLYTLLRYKRWAEWFEAERLREVYASDGEDGVDCDLRRFLFESGIDYPFSQPASPRGGADVVAGMETDDPLVLEIKVRDSAKGYKENRVRDGLRQALQYATQYGKDRGHVVVFNLDPEPLSFVSQTAPGEWPARLEHGGRTIYFVDVHIADQPEPVSQRDKGKPVAVRAIDLAHLLDEIVS